MKHELTHNSAGGVVKQGGANMSSEMSSYWFSKLIVYLVVEFLTNIWSSVRLWPHTYCYIPGHWPYLVAAPPPQRPQRTAGWVRWEPGTGGPGLGCPCCTDEAVWPGPGWTEGWSCCVGGNLASALFWLYSGWGGDFQKKKEEGECDHILYPWISAAASESRREEGEKKRKLWNKQS